MSSAQTLLLGTLVILGLKFFSISAFKISLMEKTSYIMAKLNGISERAI